MGRLLLWLAMVLLLTACAPLDPALKVADCTSRLDKEQLLSENWLQQSGTWVLRQSALLEMWPRKIPLEGMLRLDTVKQKARLVAMNEMGLVLFDLELDEHGEHLHRAMPELQEQPGFAIGVAESLRRIFLQPSPQEGDHLQLRRTSQRLWRLLPGGSLGFVFDCSGDLQETRQDADAGNWRVRYIDYQPVADQRVPQQIIFDDYQHRVKLTLWLREVKQNHE